MAKEQTRSAPVLIAGAGACGLVAALAARESHADVLVIERAPEARGSTSMSSGLIPAPGTVLQRAAGIVDTPERMYADIMARTDGLADPTIAKVCSQMAGPTIDWLAQEYGVPFEFAPNWEALGHSRSRMHRLPNGAGDDLMKYLVSATKKVGVNIETNTRVVDLEHEADGTVFGALVERADGRREGIRCAALVLATSGFGASREMLREYVPEISEATYFGWPYNEGDAVAWARRLGARLEDMDAYQGHPALVDPHDISLHFEGIMAGGIQINKGGERFYNEANNPSSGALEVLRQPEGVAFVIYGQDQYEVALTRKRTKIADDLGAIRHAQSVAELASAIEVPAETLQRSIDETETLGRSGQPDRFARTFAVDHRMIPPFHAIRVRAAIFHTQGGLAVDDTGRVLREDGRPFPNLFAGGGAARGVSGPGGAGYLPGNGLLTAICLGRLAGTSAALQSAETASGRAETTQGRGS